MLRAHQRVQVFHHDARGSKDSINLQPTDQQSTTSWQCFHVYSNALLRLRETGYIRLFASSSLDSSSFRHGQAPSGMGLG